jgi:hypothetical protein
VPMPPRARRQPPIRPPPELPQELVTLIFIANESVSLTTLAPCAAVCKTWLAAAAQVKDSIRLLEFESSVGNGMGSSLGRFNQPTATLAAPDGHVWIADTHNSRLQRMVHENGRLRPVEELGPTIYGTGSTSERTILRCTHLACDGARIFVVNTLGYVYMVSTEWDVVRLQLSASRVSVPRASCPNAQLIGIAVGFERLYLLTRDLDYMVRAFRTDSWSEGVSGGVARLDPVLTIKGHGEAEGQAWGAQVGIPNGIPFEFPDFTALQAVSGPTALVQPKGIALHEPFANSRADAELFVLDSAQRRRHSGGVLVLCPRTGKLTRHFLLPRPPGASRRTRAVTSLAVVRSRLVVGEEGRVLVLSLHGHPLQLVDLPKALSASQLVGMSVDSTTSVGKLSGAGHPASDGSEGSLQGRLYAADHVRSQVHIFRCSM